MFRGALMAQEPNIIKKCMVYALEHTCDTNQILAGHEHYLYNIVQAPLVKGKWIAPHIITTLSNAPL
jgi:hypothetical protein